MKLLLLLFFPYTIQAQFDYLHLENKQVKFEKKYSLDSMKSATIQTKLVSFIPTIKGITDFYNGGEVITAKFKDAYIDYRKYGGRWGNTPPVLNHPFSANATIVWKDSAFKATITNMVFHVAGLGDIAIDDLITKKKGTQFGNGKVDLSIGKYIEQYLADLFVINDKSKDW